MCFCGETMILCRSFRGQFWWTSLLLVRNLCKRLRPTRNETKFDEKMSKIPRDDRGSEFPPIPGQNPGSGTRFPPKTPHVFTGRTVRIDNHEDFKVDTPGRNLARGSCWIRLSLNLNLNFLLLLLLRPPLKSQSWGPNPSLEAQIPVSRPKS